MARICGDCWRIARPDEYEPDTFVLGECDGCGAHSALHRARQSDLLTIAREFADYDEEQQAIYDATWPSLDDPMAREF